MIDIIILITGIIFLALGGDALIRGAVAIAERMAISPLVIGLTIVSLGTSAPELFISIDAAWLGLGGLAVGNVVGSNIANVLLVLGLPAIFATTPCTGDNVQRSMIVMIGFMLLFMVMLYFSPLTWYHGAILLGLLGLFLYEQYRSAQAGGASILAEGDDHESTHDPLWKSIAYLIFGAVVLPLGAHLTVAGAKEIAVALGLSDAVIGLTVVAIGTSLPELAASLTAVLKGKPNVAIGNVVGSNIFNIAAIMGITTLIVPVTPGDHIVNFDMWIMLAVALLLYIISTYLGKIGFKTALAMVTGYLVYIAAAVLQ